MHKEAYLYTKDLIYVLLCGMATMLIMGYILTADMILSFAIALITFSIMIITYHLFSGKIIITDEGIKTKIRLFKWDEVSLIAVYPYKFITIYLKLPSAIHRVGAGIRVRCSDIAQYTIRYDEELINIFKNKTNGKVQIKNMPYYSFNSLINSLKKH
ncbi:hypothetical protein [Methanothermococcus sp.]|uniref:hypothetical protein n=1 Tax=Methanothermococcus sp. TaxID=2614238 RepID=UPI0025D0231F|nr:hypothetical protein [Methanothermococcus sp.]